MVWRSIASLCLLLGALAPNLAQASPQEQCAQLGRPNIDCSCVARRVEAYEGWAKNDDQKALVGAAYAYSLGLESDYEQRLQGLASDQARIDWQMHFDPVGGPPVNLDDFESSCVIAGAPKAQLPEMPTFPAAQKLYQVCVNYPSDPRYCQCTVAQQAGVMSPDELAAYYYSFNENGAAGGDQMSNNSDAAAKMGATPARFAALNSSARAKLSGTEDMRGNYCGALLFGDNREGRSDAARAGIPLGFENPNMPQTMEDIELEMARGAAEGRRQAAEIDQKAMAADTQAQADAAMAALPPVARNEGTGTGVDDPRALLMQGCAADGNAPSHCACIADVFDEAVTSSGASKGVATQLMVLMGGGGLPQATSLMQNAQQADLIAAGQLFAGNLMQVMACQ